MWVREFVVSRGGTHAAYEPDSACFVALFGPWPTNPVRAARNRTSNCPRSSASAARSAAARVTLLRRRRRPRCPRPRNPPRWCLQPSRPRSSRRPGPARSTGRRWSRTPPARGHPRGGHRPRRTPGRSWWHRHRRRAPRPSPRLRLPRSRPQSRPQRPSRTRCGRPRGRGDRGDPRSRNPRGRAPRACPISACRGGPVEQEFFQRDPAAAGPAPRRRHVKRPPQPAGHRSPDHCRADWCDRRTDRRGAGHRRRHAAVRPSAASAPVAASACSPCSSCSPIEVLLGACCCARAHVTDPTSTASWASA